MEQEKNAAATECMAAPLQAAARQTWAEVDLAALAGNYNALQSLLSRGVPDNPRIIPVVKANAYGHGMIPVARRLAEAGATMFAVGMVEEAVALRQSGIAQDILTLGTVWQGQEATALQHRITLACDHPAGIASLEAVAESRGETASVHIKVDTGMGRLGAQWDSLDPLLKAIKSAAHIRVTGTFSHLSSAEEEDRSYTQEQIRRFECALARIREFGLDPGEIHFANSGGILYHERLRGWSARTGIALYGYPPDPQRTPVRLSPILQLKTRIAAIHMLKEGEALGYSRRFRAARPTRVAILPIGYADGFNRRFSRYGKVIIRGRFADVIGAVSMDMITIDLTDMPEIPAGEEVILIGSTGGARMTAEDWAERLQTIPYEVLCALALRIPRIYVS